MSELHGVGVNGEPDDFAARYDRMLTIGGIGWVVKTAIGILALLAAGAAIWSILPF